MAVKPKFIEKNWKDIESDEANDAMSPRDMQTTPMSDDEQSKRIKTALKGYGTKDMEAPRMSDKEQTRRITKALIPTKKPAPVAKPTMKSAPTSKYRGGRSEEDINRMVAEATPDRMRASQFEEDNPDATPYKKGGAVKSGASRGDGCAQRGRTRGTMR